MSPLIQDGLDRTDHTVSTASKNIERNDGSCQVWQVCKGLQEYHSTSELQASEQTPSPSHSPESEHIGSPAYGQQDIQNNQNLILWSEKAHERKVANMPT